MESYLPKFGYYACIAIFMNFLSGCTEKEEPNLYKRAYKLYGAGQVDSALLVIENIPKIIISDFKQLGDTYYLKGYIFENLTRFNQAVDAYHQSAHYYQLAGSQKGFENCQHTIGNVYLRTGQYKIALDYYRRSSRGEKFLLKDMGLAFRGLNYYDSALYYLYESAEAMVEEKYTGQYLGNLYNELGITYYEKDEIPLALKSYKRALNIAKEGKHFELESRVLNNIGNSYFSVGRDSLAGYYFSQSLEFQDSAVMMVTYRRIGDTYFHQGKYEEAIEYYRKVSKIGLLVESEELIHSITFLIKCYISSGESAKAMMMTDKLDQVNNELRERRQLLEKENQNLSYSLFKVGEQESGITISFREMIVFITAFISILLLISVIVVKTRKNLSK